MIRADIERFLITMFFAGSKSEKHRSFKHPTDQGEYQINILTPIVT
jgi:hypothetical protein